mmetsp:Transcript_33049/g.91312  ORF Transcript_33049/g.91312 Transcript_33049/m.91312 type:complete len:128 (-) Transcript_33049:14-397(-)
MATADTASAFLFVAQQLPYCGVQRSRQPGHVIAFCWKNQLSKQCAWKSPQAHDPRATAQGTCGAELEVQWTQTSATGDRHKPQVPSTGPSRGWQAGGGIFTAAAHAQRGEQGVVQGGSRGGTSGHFC